MAIPFIASQISGVTLQDDVSSAVPRSYIDTISGNALTNYFQSTQGKILNDWYIASGEKLSTISGSLSTRINALGSFDPTNYITSSNALELFADSSTHAPVLTWYSESASKISQITSSGTKYGQSYVSSMAVKSAGYLDVAYGWVDAPATVTHGLGVIPKDILVQPSGVVTFGCVVNDITTTQFDIDITAAGSRTVSWRAEA